jgi:hypothetical protein
MLKFLLWASFLMIALFDCNAQIKILYLNTPFAPGIIHRFNASLTGFKVPKADSAQAWNYSTLQLLNATDTTLYAPLPYAFNASKNAVYSGFDRFREKITSNTIVRSTQVFDKDSSGISLAGNIVLVQKFSLYNYFGNHKDSLFIPLDNEYFRINRITFPTASHSVYKAKAVKVLKFNITIDTLKMYKAPGTKRTIYNVKDTVAGWGALRIPSPPFTSSIPYKVLLVRRKLISVDSFYVNGKPMDPILMLALGMQQAVKTTDYKEFFYRTGSPDPLMTISFGTDSTFKTPVAVLYSADSIKTGIAVEGLQSIDFKLFPNPSNSGIIHGSITKNSIHPWHISVTSALGQAVLERQISDMGIVNFDLELPNAAGIFFVAVKNEDGFVVAEKKVMRMR